jgi:glycosyltransferase involved in cell wall biosynthesis
MSGVTTLEAVRPGLADLPPPPDGKTGWPWTAESTRLPSTTPGGLAWPRLTVVTPSFNQAEFLEATLRSVLLQGYPNLEYVVVDGGSGDASVDIIDRYRPWLSYAISEPDAGQYFAINHGFGVSNGAVMTWLNSDDMCAPNALWAVGRIFAELGDRVDWLTGLPAMWDRDGNLGLVLPRPRLNRQLMRVGAYDGLTLNFIQQEGTFWTRALWQHAGGGLDTSLALAADYELWCRFADHAQLYSASLVLAGSRRHPLQATARAMTRYTRDMEHTRARRPWAWTERHRLLRGVKRRVARGVALFDSSQFQVIFDPGEMRWTIH